jgi:ABC-type glycerol-3-phosphate transport system substrate-binding protein
MKRVIVLSVLVLALAVLGGQAFGASPKPVVLTYWVTTNMQDAFALAQEERFAKKYPNIIFNKVLISEGASATDPMVAFAAGTNPDFYGTGAPQMARLAYAGVAKPLDDYFKAWPDIAHIKKEVLDNYRIGGHYYALPLYSYTMVLCYNKKLFADAGVTVPQTWDDWVSVSKKLTNPAKQQWGMNLLVSQWTEWWFEYFVWMAGGNLTKENPDGTLTLTFTDPAVVKAVEFYRKFVASKSIQPDLTLEYGNMQGQFSAGHAAMTLYGSDGLHNFVNQGMKIGDVGYAELPVGPSGKRVSQIGGGVEYIFSNVSKEKADAAWAWISFWNTKEEQEANLKYRATLGGADPQVLLRDDLDVTLGKINPELQAVVDRATRVSQLEFYGKGVVGSFVDKAVQTCVFNPNADIVATFRQQQNLAQSAADEFNKQVLASKGGNKL